jgi:hypothetical protein
MATERSGSSLTVRLSRMNTYRPLVPPSHHASCFILYYSAPVQLSTVPNSVSAAACPRISMALLGAHDGWILPTSRLVHSALWNKVYP